MTDNFEAITCEEFLQAAREFVEISNRISDGWKLHEDKTETQKSYLMKNLLIELSLDKTSCLVNTEFVIFYNLSYGVPAFSFNMWNSSGVLISLEDIRKMSFTKMSEKEFYSVITQQEHPIFFKPYFVMHPCHTASLLTSVKDKSRNIIVTFLSLITPLIRLKLPLEYGL